MKPTDFSMLLTAFLSEYLPLQKNVSRNTIMSYPYFGSSFKTGKYWSERVSTEEGVLPPALNYEDNGTSLSIQLEGFRKCNVVSTYSYFPFAYEDGCFHLIDDVF